MANLGVPSIPFLFPFDECDYQATFEWLNQRPDINKVAVLAQYYKTPNQFAQFLKNMRKLQAGADKQLHFLVVGVARPHRITAILDEFDATIVTWKPFQAATAGLRTIENLGHPEDDELRFGISRGELAGRNIGRFQHYCEEPMIRMRSAA
jgi:hypothetical protein